MDDGESRSMDGIVRDRRLAELLEKLVNDVCDVVDVRVTFSDMEGIPLAKSRYQCDFCGESQRRPEWASRCRACAREAGQRAGGSDGVFYYRCWRGLMSAALRVTVNGAPVGYFVVSGYVCSPEKMAETEQIFPDPAMQITPGEMERVQHLQFEHVTDIIRTVSIAAKYLTEALQRQQAEDAQRQAEFRALQSQISPHFLFNTLNSISQMAVLEGAEQAPEAIYTLANLLRHTMRQNMGQVSLREELAFVREYIHIKELLGHGAIRYMEELEPGTEDMPVPSFTVQPLVENAVTHGLEPLGSGGIVAVCAYWRENSLVISVTDDGAGFAARSVPAAKSQEVSGIGFSNVVERLSLFYGADFRYDVVSAPNQGATVTLRIPVTA